MLKYKFKTLNNMNIISPRTKMFYMFMMFIWVASVSPLTGFNFGKNPILMPIYCLILIYFHIKYCKYSYRPLKSFIIIYISWFVLNIIKNGGFQNLNFVPIYSILIVHVAFNIFNKDEFIHYFIKILVFFSSISLITWLLVNILGVPMVNFMRSISVIEPSSPADSYCILTGICSHIEMGIRRNLGFTWEPGRYSCWVLLGMYFYLIKRKFKIFPIKQNKAFIILFMSLLSTMSTTGYLGLFVILLFYLVNKKSNSQKILLITLSILIIPSILSLSFMWEKIHSLTNLDEGLQSINYYSGQGQEEICPQRFTGLYVSSLNFIHDIWLGYNNSINSYFNVEYMERMAIVEPSEGILRILGKYGLFVGILLYLCLVKSSRFLSKAYDYKGRYFFLLFFVVISFSYDFWENCIFMYIYLSVFYHNLDKRYFNVI